MGDIVIALYSRIGARRHGRISSKLAEAGYYDGIDLPPAGARLRHPGRRRRYGKAASTRKVAGGPGYTIKDEPVVGDYIRGIVAMARTAAPDSQGSQFFIVLDGPLGPLPKSGGYVIFGQVISGMDVVEPSLPCRTPAALATPRWSRCRWRA